MLFKEYLIGRKSTREYSSKKVETERIQQLKFAAKEVTEKIGSNLIGFEFFENGDDIYEKLEGRGGYSGVMIKSPHYFGVKMANDEKETRIKAAYAMQSVLKAAFELGIGTCWVDISNVPHSLELELAGDEEHIVNYLFALGYPKEKSFFDFKSKISAIAGINKFDIKRELKSEGSSRLPISELVYLDKWGENAEYETLEQWGLDELFYHLRNAPSHMNAQPWRFVLDNDVIKLGMLRPNDEANLTDIGIMMYLFEGLANEMGMKETWTIDISEICEDHGEAYQLVAVFDM
ncbi:MAG: hypothetical protein N4A40_00080 [Tissierellales bacterium]|jgi:hypothetical protein|nr:hypothetical protein [Tissierellales bacterium]